MWNMIWLMVQVLAAVNVVMLTLVRCWEAMNA